MKLLVTMTAAVAVLLVVAGPCSALWWHTEVTPNDAPRMGIEVRSTPLGAGVERVEMEFTTDGGLKGFTRVDLLIGGGDKVITAPLKEDRSKPGKVVVSFSTPRDRLGEVRLLIPVPMPEALGGATYVVKVKDFVEEKGR